jgi:hypothetical protein
MSSKKCLQCKDDFEGRIDKKFCSDQCRNEFNNNLRRDSNNYVRNVNNILRRNRRILEEFNPTGKAKVSKDKLAYKGFNFHYHTNMYETRSGKRYFFCYEQGYLQLEDHWYALVHKEKYVE